MKIIMLAAILVLPLAQNATPYAGMWTAELGGRTFVRLELSTAENSTAGRIGLGDIELDKTGRLRKVSEAPALTPIQDVNVKGSVVTFAHKDGTNVDHFQLSVLRNGTAELVPLLSDKDKRELASSGIAEFKPIKLTRAR
jgi:hypothetical protein